MAERVTRLAPSPTGSLHLGNLRSFLINWAVARRAGWRIVLRIEDLDAPRNKPDSADEAMAIMRWLGLDWDGDPLYQSHDLAPYHAALDHLAAQGLIYRCPATRREVLAATSAPHAEDHEVRYPGLYRPPHAPAILPGVETATRLIVPDGPVAFTDELLGPQAFDVQQEVGDFILETKAGLPAYQLAVVVDDARQGVTDVVRGDDLLRSAARQVLLYRLLGLGDPPRYHHLPLVLGDDGRRLAKRHANNRAVTYFQGNIDPAQVVGLLAHWSGLCDRPTPMTAADFRDAFTWDKLPPHPVTFTPSDHAWLTQ